jgi:hypothetical protein
MKITVTLDDGSSYAATVEANAPVRVNRFTGAGLVNALAAVQAVRR